MTNPPLEALGRYMTARDQQRLERVEEQLQAMTRRERRLVREAAVMGYVRGAMFGEVKANARQMNIPEILAEPKFPHDRDVVLEVLSACDAMPDLYPVISHLKAQGGQ